MTSHDVVARVRRITKVKRSGHGGTLDPLAEGVLPMALGQACRLIDYLPSDKTYYAEILLGKTTSTDDLEGEVIDEKDAATVAQITREQIEKVIDQFRGEIKQHPPVYSAIKVDGQRLYDLARKGKAPEKAPERTVTVHQLDILSIDVPKVCVRVHCSKGTYIRSIARDIGVALGVGGCLSKLVREKAGFLSLDTSHSLDQIQDCVDKGDWQPLFTDLTVALGFAKVEIVETDIEHLFNGRNIELPSQTGAQDQSPHLLAVRNGVYLALLKHIEGTTYKPEVVFSDARLSP